MRVLLLNGSPHAKGCTYTALSEVAAALEEEGIDSRIIQTCREPVRGCVGCGKCSEAKRCVFQDDAVNEVLDEMDRSDALVVGSPVYYASPNGSLLAFLDRMFYAGGSRFSFKPAAAVASARRAGTTATLDVLEKYFTISQMPVVSSCYWNVVHGNTPEEVVKDLEGMQVMRALGRNMAWLLKCIQAGRESKIPYPAQEGKIATNFIR